MTNKEYEVYVYNEKLGTMFLRAAFITEGEAFDDYLLRTKNKEAGMNGVLIYHRGEILFKHRYESSWILSK